MSAIEPSKQNAKNPPREPGKRMDHIFFAFIAAIAIVFAASRFPDHAWGIISNPQDGYVPDFWLKWGSYAAVAVAVICTWGLIYFHLEIRRQYADHLVSIDNPEDRRAKILVQDSGYQEFEPIETTDDEGQTDRIRIFALPAKLDQRKIIQRKVIMLEGTSEASVTYTVLLNDYAWKMTSDREFQGTKDQGIPIADAMANGQIQESIETARYIVTIGLASAERGELSDEDNDKLSIARGTNLAIALLNQKSAKSSYQPMWALGAGYSNRLPESIADPAKERVAVLIAIQYTDQAFNVERFVLAMNRLLVEHGIDLTDYSREPENFITNNSMTPGPYLDWRDVTFDRRENDDFIPVITPPSVEAQPQQNSEQGKRSEP